jgi:hypothetical protein
MALCLEIERLEGWPMVSKRSPVRDRASAWPECAPATPLAGSGRPASRSLSSGLGTAVCTGPKHRPRCTWLWLPDQTELAQACEGVRTRYRVRTRRCRHMTNRACYDARVHDDHMGALLTATASHAELLRLGFASRISEQALSA